MPLPLLILDVDGVLLPLPENPGRDPASSGYHDARAGGFDVWVPDHVCLAMPALRQRFEIMWGTTWDRDIANEDVAPLFGLTPMASLDLQAHAGRGWAKLTAARAAAPGRALAWADDHMTSTARAWARRREEPTLLIKPRSEVGLSSRHIQELIRFADTLNAAVG